MTPAFRSALHLCVSKKDGSRQATELNRTPATIFLPA